MQATEKELQLIIKTVKAKLPARGAYKRIVSSSQNKVSINQVKKVFSGQKLSLSVTETIVKHALLIVKEDKAKLTRLKKMAAA